MAKLSAHGAEIGRIAYTTFILAFMSDGKILRNNGNGWKLYKKCKDGVNPEDVFAKRAASQKEHLSARPCAAAYVKELHALTSIKNRWKLNEAVKMMPSDPDGVWSEACDGYGDNVHADISEIVELCRMYRAAEAEFNSLKAESLIEEA